MTEVESGIDVLFSIEGATESPALLSKVITALSDLSVLRPTHASPDERVRHPFDAKGTTTLLGSTLNATYVSLWRTKKPRFDGIFGVSSRPINKLRVTLRGNLSVKMASEIFGESTELSQVLRPVYGLVHMWFRGGDRTEMYNAASGISGSSIYEFGLAGLFARTWLSPKLSAQLKDGTLEALGAVSETSWGALQVDTLEEPWTKDMDAHLAVFEKSRSVFREQGLLGTYAGTKRRWKKAERWVPIEL